MTNKDREAFEAWVNRDGGYLNDSDDTARVARTIAWRAWQAACAWQKEKDAKLCEAYAIDRHALYKGKPPYTGKEPGRYDPYTEGASDAADLLADKIRSGS